MKSNKLNNFVCLVTVITAVFLISSHVASAVSFPMNPAFSPSIPSSVNGTVDYTFEYVGSSDGDVPPGDCGQDTFINVHTKTLEYGTVGIATVRDRGKIETFTDAVIANCTDAQYEWATHWYAAKNGSTYSPAGPAGWFWNSLHGVSYSERNGEEHWANFISQVPVWAQVTTEPLYQGDGWWLEYSHGTNWFFLERTYQFNCEGWDHQCFPLIYCPSAYYKITVHIEQNATMPSLASLGIPDLGGWGTTAGHSGQLTDTNIVVGPLVNSVNDHLYCLLSEMNWPNAQAKAIKLGGHLVTINDSSENDWVFNTFGSFGGINRTLWVGLQDSAVESTFVWISGDSTSYRKWSPGEPNNGGGYFPNEDHVSMLAPGSGYAGYWNDVSGVDWHYGAVVEIDPNNPPQPSLLAGPVTNSANGHIYYLLAETYWPVAEAYAGMLSGHLVTINDSNENDWILNTFGSVGNINRSLWIGLNDVTTESTFVWVSGDTASYRKWSPGEPNNGGGYFPNEDHVTMRGPGLSYSGYWNDAPGDFMYAAVVEVP